MSVSFVPVSNKDSLSNSETGVNGGIRSWKKAKKEKKKPLF
jgi:hypothetical protein